MSTSLVSKVLNNREVRISDMKKKQILKIARECRYQPRQMKGPAPVRAHKNLIGLILPSFEFDFLTQLCNVIQQHAHENGFDIIVMNTDEDVAQERRCLEICRDCGVDGILLDSCDNHENIDQIKMLIHEGMPIVLVDRYIYDLDCDIVATNNFKGSYQLTNSLIEKGHKDILYVFHGKAMFTTVQNDRFAGYQAAMTEHGLNSIKEYIYSDRSLKYQPLYHVDNGAKHFTAIVLSTTWDFMRLFELLDLMNFSPSEKLDVTAFDLFNLPYDAMEKNKIFSRINPEITILQQDLKTMGVTAVDFLIDHIKEKNRDKTSPPKQIFLDSKLITVKGI